MLCYWRAFMDFFDKQIAAHKVNYEEEESRDYVEAYLKEKKKCEDQGDFKSYRLAKFLLSSRLVYQIQYPPIEVGSF